MPMQSLSCNPLLNQKKKKRKRNFKLLYLMAQNKHYHFKWSNTQSKSILDKSKSRTQQGKLQILQIHLQCLGLSFQSAQMVLLLHLCWAHCIKKSPLLVVSNTFMKFFSHIYAVIASSTFRDNQSNASFSSTAFHCGFSRFPALFGFHSRETVLVEDNS